MQYISTRGKTQPMNFSDVLLMGLAPDGGLMLPESYPKIDTETLEQWRILSEQDNGYAKLALEVMKLFITDIDETDLAEMINLTYTEEVFGDKDIVPVRTLTDDIHILALSHGPTLAFKDIAMQFLGNAFEYVLKKKGERLTIIGATSGDTGSAAEYALRGKENIEVFMLSPHEKMSEFQRAQMYSLTDANIHNIAIKGMFDDCQDIIKALQEDAEFKRKYTLGTVNSINWGRILAQIVYYFKAYFASTTDNSQKVSFCIPSGNFGNICAGHIAREMGLPVDRLIVATNENDVLHEFFSGNKEQIVGRYQPRSADNTYVTSSPSMDISKASNFERFIYLLLDKDGDKVNQLFTEIKLGNGFNIVDLADNSEDVSLTSKMSEKFGFTSGKSTHADRLATIKAVFDSTGDLIDPHTADGVKVAKECQQQGEVIICAETALPAKFAETMREAIGDDLVIPRPDHTQNIEELKQYVIVHDNDASKVAEEIMKVVAPR